MLEKYDTANKEGKFRQGYKQNHLLHFILVHWVISGTILWGAQFNHQLNLKTRNFRGEQFSPRKWDRLLHRGNVLLLENRSGCQVRNALGRL